MFRKSDFLLIAALLASAVIIAFFSINAVRREGRFVTIYHDGSIYGPYPFNKPEKIDITNENEVILTAVIADGGIYVAYSGCRDQYCVHMGIISKTGEIIACLPNRVIIRAEGGDGFDAITY